MSAPVLNGILSLVTLSTGQRTWEFVSAPHVRQRLRRLFAQADKQVGIAIRLPFTPQTAEDILWILERYPHTVTWPERQLLIAQAGIAEEQRRLTAEAMEADLPQPEGIVKPLRAYQLQAVQIGLTNRQLLLGDDIGLGKTASGIGMLCDPQSFPAVVVCQVHVQRQWAEQIAAFAPSLSTHIIKSRGEYHLPPAHVYIISYSKLAAWRDRMKPKAIIYDEAQELRRQDSDKWAAAKTLSDGATLRVGLTATPVYNYGDEIHPVMECIAPGALGTREEFLKEWATWDGRHYRIQDPVALGSWLRDTGLMLRRTRADVGRELPPKLKIPHTISYDAKVLQRLKHEAHKLAVQILEGSFTERGQASRKLDNILRQATGIAKAPHAAEFIADLSQNGPVVVGAWHREVWTIIRAHLDKKKIKSVLYTGSESPTQKDAAKKAIIDGQARVLLMSLRSGAGLDGLQHVAKLVCYAELDWSPKVHDQFSGRLHRDGQTDEVTEYFLVADHGSDPKICEVLGIKGAQSDGIVDLQAGGIVDEGVEVSRGEALARAWLAQEGQSR